MVLTLGGVCFHLSAHYCPVFLHLGHNIFIFSFLFSTELVQNIYTVLHVVLLHGIIDAWFFWKAYWEHFFQLTFALCKNVLNLHYLTKYFLHAPTCSAWGAAHSVSEPHVAVQKRCSLANSPHLRKLLFPCAVLFWLTFEQPFWYLNFSA